MELCPGGWSKYVPWHIPCVIGVDSHMWAMHLLHETGFCNQSTGFNILGTMYWWVLPIEWVGRKASKTLLYKSPLLGGRHQNLTLYKSPLLEGRHQNLTLYKSPLLEGRHQNHTLYKSALLVGTPQSSYSL